MLQSLGGQVLLVTIPTHKNVSAKPSVTDAAPPPLETFPKAGPCVLACSSAGRPVLNLEALLGMLRAQSKSPKL